MNQRWSTDLQLPLHIYSTNWPIPLLCSLSMSVPWMKNLFTFSLLIWKGLIDMVRNKNFEALHQSGGVKAVAVVLETNIKGIISGNGAALIQRENFLLPISSKRHLLLARNKNACLIYSFIKDLYRKWLLVVILIGKITWSYFQPDHDLNWA